MVPSLKDRFLDQEYLSPEQVRQLSKEGFSIDLDPPDSGFWRRPVVSPSRFDSSSFHRSEAELLAVRHSDQQVDAMLNPDATVSVHFKQVKTTKGESPKIYVEYGQQRQKWKMKFVTDKYKSPSSVDVTQTVRKALISSEVNVEPVVNALAAAIGFSIDPTYFKKKVRFYLPDHVYDKQEDFDDYLETKVLYPLATQYDSFWNVRSAFERVLVDERAKICRDARVS